MAGINSYRWMRIVSVGGMAVAGGLIGEVIANTIPIPVEYQETEEAEIEPGSEDNSDVSEES